MPKACEARLPPCVARALEPALLQLHVTEAPRLHAAEALRLAWQNGTRGCGVIRLAVCDMCAPCDIRSL